MNFCPRLWPLVGCGKARKKRKIGYLKLAYTNCQKFFIKLTNLFTTIQWYIFFQ